MPGKSKLFWRLLARGLTGPPAVAALLFIPAGTFKFWQAWVVIALHSIAGLCSSLYFFRHDPQVLERRLLRKEPLSEQKFIIRFWKILVTVSLVVAGFDFRLGWSNAFLGSVPVWLELLSLLFILGGCALHFQVLKDNRFAASVIQIEAGQNVATIGLYGLVRHPMYLGFAVTGLFTPLALGSLVALPIGLLILFLIICRLLSEEKFLGADLPGYSDYCQRTRYRLIPFVW